MPNQTLLEVQKGFGRAHTKKSAPLGPLVAELQDHVEDIEIAVGVAGATFTGNNAKLATEEITIPVSFEANEVGTISFYFTQAVTVNKIRGVTVKTLAGTDSGTITAKNNGGSAMAGGVLTGAASDPVGTEYVATPTTNNTFTAGQKLQLTTAKTTPGGRVLVTIEYTLTLP